MKTVIRISCTMIIGLVCIVILAAVSAPRSTTAMSSESMTRSITMTEYAAKVLEEMKKSEELKKSKKFPGAIIEHFSQIKSDYASNEYAADKKYGGKFVITIVYADAVKKELFGGYSLEAHQIGNGSILPDIICEPKNAVDLEHIRIGQPVVVAGKITSDLLYLRMKECTYIQFDGVTFK